MRECGWARGVARCCGSIRAAGAVSAEPVRVRVPARRSTGVLLLVQLLLLLLLLLLLVELVTVERCNGCLLLLVQLELVLPLLLAVHFGRGSRALQVCSYCIAFHQRDQHTSIITARLGPWIDLFESKLKLTHLSVAALLRVQLSRSGRDSESRPGREKRQRTKERAERQAHGQGQTWMRRQEDRSTRPAGRPGSKRLHPCTAPNHINSTRSPAWPANRQCSPTGSSSSR